MHAVWIVRSRQIGAKLGWWLALIGYNRRDDSFTGRLYLVYVAIFMVFWIAAVLSLLAGPVAAVLAFLVEPPLNQAAVGLGTLALLAWGLYLLWQASRRSPVVFSEEDAYLICQEPVPGAGVALTWFLGDWFETAALFGAGALTLSIALVDAGLPENVPIDILPTFVAAGLRALLATALVPVGIMALVWAAGTLRLQRDRRLRWGPMAVRGVIIVTVAGLLLTLARYGVAGLDQGVWQVLLLPIRLPLEAAFSVAPLWAGLAAGFVLAGLGLAALAWGGVHLNLSRAAQETTQRAMIAAARRYGQTDVIQQISQRERLGGGHAPSRWPLRPGVWALVWKGAVQSTRSFSLRGIGNWLLLFLVGLLAIMANDLALSGLALAFWSVMVGQRVTDRLQKDLGYWTLLRQLPFSSDQLLVAELALPWVLSVLTVWVALIIAPGPAAVRLQAALVLPCGSAAASLAAAYDLVRRARTDSLLSGIPPKIGALGGLLSILCLAIPVVIWFGLAVMNIGGVLPAILAGVLLALGFRRLASRQLQEMR